MVSSDNRKHDGKWRWKIFTKKYIKFHQKSILFICLDLENLERNSHPHIKTLQNLIITLLLCFFFLFYVFVCVYVRQQETCFYFFSFIYQRHTYLHVYKTNTFVHTMWSSYSFSHNFYSIDLSSSMNEWIKDRKKIEHFLIIFVNIILTNMTHSSVNRSQTSVNLVFSGWS